MSKKIILLLFLIVIFPYSVLEAYDDEITHRDLTIEAVKNSALKNYLPQNLGEKFSANYESLINGKAIIDWIKDGAIAEDSPLCRASNHFHNPLKPWDQSYMSDEPWWIQAWCGLTGYSTKYSIVTWGTGYLAPSPNGPKVTISNQEWGWDNARSYYYLALTSTSNSDREKYFANTFQTLGQVLHLIEDGAQPGQEETV